MNTTAYSATHRPVVLLCVILAIFGREVFAEEALKIRLYTSVVPGEPSEVIRTCTRRLLDVIEADVGYQLKLEIEAAESEKELYEFAEAIKHERVHAGIMWGLEYGWLRNKFGELELKPLVLAKRGEEAWKVYFGVDPRSHFQTFRDLRDTRLARYEGTPLPDLAYYADLLKRCDTTEKDHFEQVNTDYDNPRDAIFDVREGKADCVLINTVTYSRHLALHEHAPLRQVETSTPFPQPVVIGREDVVNRLKSDLWEDLEAVLLNFLSKPDRETRLARLSFFQLDGFAPRDRSFETLVKRSAAQYPISLLEELELENRSR